MSTKPLLPNEYKINDNVIVAFRLIKQFNVEIYKLINEQYLILFLDMDIKILKNKKDQFNIFEIKFGNKFYNAFVSENSYEEKINNLTQEITEMKGFDAVAGMDDLKRQLLADVIYPLTHTAEYEKFKLTLPNGILLYGPPGCGKTYIVRKLAEEINYNFFELKHSDVASTYIHGAVEKIAEVFNKAKLYSPSLVFIDELEGLLPNRSDLGGNNSHKLEEINEFLMHLNDAGKNKVLVIGATNQPNLIDKAILRSGRFDKKIEVKPPDFDARKHLFKFYLSDRPFEDVDFDLLAEKTTNYSCSDIEFIVNESARYAVTKNKNYIDTDLILEVIKKNPSSI